MVHFVVFTPTFDNKVAGLFTPPAEATVLPQPLVTTGIEGQVSGLHWVQKEFAIGNIGIISVTSHWCGALLACVWPCIVAFKKLMVRAVRLRSVGCSAAAAA